MPTVSVRKEDVTRKWYLVDAENKVLGRLASEVAKILRGKHKPIYTPHVDTGDYVIVINAEKVALTGEKWQQKHYRWHTGYPGGLREVSAQALRQRHPERLITLAVRGMLPKTKLGRAMLRKLKVYAGSTHPHAAQRPEPLVLP
ncbi:MAG: 50S ribosomal protein L13 [Candidatus Tectimicrobiota bacterium]|nr:MAG: 50S ribosomal protein L13 [Candidatus Tectomicrobia bacterium]